MTHGPKLDEDEDALAFITAMIWRGLIAFGAVVGFLVVVVLVLWR